jgi:hypothetical protein
MVSCQFIDGATSMTPTNPGSSRNENGDHIRNDSLVIPEAAGSEFGRTGEREAESSGKHHWIQQLQWFSGLRYALTCGILLFTPHGGMTPRASAQEPPKPVNPYASWQLKPSLIDKDKKEAENISGLACSPLPNPVCVLLSDEQSNGRYVRFATYASNTLIPQRILQLLDPISGKETDTEGAAYDQGFFYLVGSHGVEKKKGEYAKDRNWLFRFRPDANKTTQVERTNAIEPLLASLPDIKGFACPRNATAPCRSLQEDGVNIEGLAVADGQAWIGLRSPLLQGESVVIRTSIDGLFGQRRPDDAKLYRINLGPNRGIRDMARVSGGFLLLSGKSRPEADQEQEQPLPATVLYWSGDSQPAIPIATLMQTGPIQKPEAMMLLSEDKNEWRILVLGEGKGSVTPKEYRLPKIK